MKAIARLVWTYLTALPILRWVGAIALVSLPFGVLALWPRTRGFMVLPVIAFAIHSLSMSIAAGYLFRVLSSPRSHRFLPHFRGRSLAAFLVIVALVSAPWLVIIAWAAVRPPYAVTLVGPLFILLAIVGITFFPVGATVTLALLLGAAWGFARFATLPEAGATPSGSEFGPLAMSVFMLGVWVVIWAAFSIWYLRVRRIEPFQPVAVILDRLGLRPSAGSIVFDRRRALAAILAAAYPQGTKQTLFFVALLVIGPKLAAGFASGAHIPYTAAFFVPALVIPGVLLAAIANILSRRTKSLWLKSGLSRRALLAEAEKQIWRTAAPRSIAVSVALATAIALTYDVPMPVLARGVVSGGSTALLAIYMGMVLVRDSRFIESCIAALVMLSAGVTLWAAFSAPTRDGVWLATTVAQAAAALLFRSIAIAQWRSIDWLVFKPIRISSQNSR